MFLLRKQSSQYSIRCKTIQVERDVMTPRLLGIHLGVLLFVDSVVLSNTQFLVSKYVRMFFHCRNHTHYGKVAFY